MKLLVTVSMWSDDRIAQALRDVPEVEAVRATTPEEQVREAVDADAVLGQITREAFLAARKLRWIQSPSAGVEWTARVPELRDSQVIVTNTRGAHAKTIAEHTFGMLIALARGFRHLFEAQERREWKRPPDVPMFGLSGLTLGIVGLGNIGRAIASRGAAFEMRVIAVDALPEKKPEYVAELAGLDGLPDLLKQSDAVAVAVPYTAETKGMLGAAQLALMKPSAYLLVVSRGGIVDERALVAMLREGRLAGAGLDVQATEPLPADDPLWDAPNLIITPHCSGMSAQTTAATMAIFQDNLRRFLAGEPLTNTVDVRRGF